MEVKIIHYTRLAERIKNLDKQLNKYNISYDVTEEFDPENLDSELTQKFDLNKIDITNVSIFLKHINTLIDNKNNNNVIILEDDVVLVDKFKEKLTKQIDLLPSEFGFLFFDQFHKSFKVKRNLFNYNKKIYKINYYAEPNFLQQSEKRTGKTRGLGGYVFNTEYRELLRSEFDNQQGICIPIDHWLNHFINKYNLNIFWSEPALSYQGSKSGLFKSENE
tara:strand:- start:7879 stop:8538 length:660 start_codon:yes stop_codon:yes gene_type:complete